MRQALYTISLAAPLLSLAGCFFGIPAPEGKPVFHDLVGPADSIAPFRVGISTRDELVARLSGDVRYWGVCRYDPAVCFWVDETTPSFNLMLWLIVHGGPQLISMNHRHHYLFVRFDSQSRIGQYRYFSEDEYFNYQLNEQLMLFARDSAPADWPLVDPGARCPVCGWPQDSPNFDHCDHCHTHFMPWANYSKEYGANLPPVVTTSPATKPAGSSP